MRKVFFFHIKLTESPRNQMFSSPTGSPGSPPSSGSPPSHPIGIRVPGSDKVDENSNPAGEGGGRNHPSSLGGPRGTDSVSPLSMDSHGEDSDVRSAKSESLIKFKKILFTDWLSKLWYFLRELNYWQEIHIFHINQHGSILMRDFSGTV